MIIPENYLKKDDSTYSEEQRQLYRDRLEDLKAEP